MRPTAPHARPYAPQNRRARLRSDSGLRGAVAVLLLAAAATAPSPAAANPQGGTVVAGTATITTLSPGAVQVTQGSGKAVIDWQSFSIGAGEVTSFVQPSSSAITLNRVVGGNASEILGRLTANGQIWIVNPNGIFFGSSAVVDVAGLLATTQDISNADFMAGRYNFRQGGTGGYVVNEGSITVADTGLAGLVAPYVANRGIITARLGEVALASGNAFTVDFYGDQLINLALGDTIAAPVKDEAGKTATSLVQNTGKIFADGGRVTMTAAAAKGVVDKVVDTSGIVQARSVVEKNGEIYLLGEGGAVEVSGSLDASGVQPGTKGGAVVVTGNAVTLKSTAKVNVSGAAGGGQAMIGGDVQGGAATAETLATYGITNYRKPVATSKTTAVETGATISANAAANGKGGKVIVWADENTISYGSYSAKGGPQGGDGGFIETSGKIGLVVGSVPDASAALGKAGTWLLDPTDISIANTASSGGAWTGGTFSGSGTSAVVATTDIETALAAGTSVTITTTSAATGGVGNITVTDALSPVVPAGGASLSLVATNNITVNADILATGGKLNLSMQAGDTGIISVGADINTNGGTFKAGGAALATAPTSLAISTGNTVTAGDVILEGDFITVSGIMSVSGDLSITANSEFNHSALSGGITMTGTNKVLTIKADDMTLGDNINSTGTDNQVYLQGATGARPIRLAPNTVGGSLNLTDAELATIDTNFKELKIGVSTSGGAITIQDDASVGGNGTYTLPIATTLKGGGISITNAGTGTTLSVPTTGSLSLYSGGSAFALDAGTGLSAANLWLQAPSITINGALTKTSANPGIFDLKATDASGMLTINASATLTAAGAVNTTLNANTSIHLNTVWNAGAGSFTLGKYSGGTDPTVTLGNTITADSLTATVGQTTLSGGMVITNDTNVTSTNGSIVVSGALTSTSGSFTFNAAANQLFEQSAAGTITVPAGKTVTIKADSINLAGGAASINAGVNGTVVLAPTMNTTTVGLAGGTGTFNLTATELNTINATNLKIGNVSGAAIDVGTAGTSFTIPVNVSSLYLFGAGGMTFNGRIEGAGKTLKLDADGGNILFGNTVGYDPIGLAAAPLLKLDIDPPANVTAGSNVYVTNFEVQGATGTVNFTNLTATNATVNMPTGTFQGTYNVTNPWTFNAAASAITTTGGTVTNASTGGTHTVNGSTITIGGGGGGGGGGGTPPVVTPPTVTPTTTPTTTEPTPTTPTVVDGGSGTGGTSTDPVVVGIVDGISPTTLVVAQQVAKLSSEDGTTATTGTTLAVGGLTLASGDPLPVLTSIFPILTTKIGSTTGTTTLPLDDTGLPAYPSGAGVSAAAVQGIIAEFKQTTAASSAADAVADLAAKQLSNSEVRAVFNSMNLGEVISSLTSGSTTLGQQIGAMLQETLKGGSVTYANVKGVLDSHGADSDLARTYLSLFQRVQKEARSDLFAGALDALRANPEAADLFASPEEGKEAKPKFSGVRLKGMTAQGLARIEGKVEHPSRFVQLRVNGRWVFVDETGGFHAEIPVQAGHNDIQLSVVDEDGDRTEHTVGVDADKATPPEGQKPREGKRVALLMATQDYQDPDIPALVTPDADTALVAKTLRERMGFDTRVVKNGTKAGLVAALTALGRELSEADSVVVYYAGHGFALPETGHGYWLPADAKTDNPTQWISNQDVARLLHRMPAKHVLLVADSCYSGAFTKEQSVSASEVERDPTALRQRRSVMAMSSGGDEPVLDGDVNSPFAEAFAAQIGKMQTFEPGVGIYQLVRGVVTKSTPQTPQYGAVRFAGYDPGGDYLFNRTDGRTKTSAR